MPPRRGAPVPSRSAPRPAEQGEQARALHTRLEEELSAYKLPRYTFFVTNAEIPMTDSGELDRRTLRDALARKVAEG
jgi:acyl-CoA synthetase (AMP-forming)/AMP-acid ligase II